MDNTKGKSRRIGAIASVAIVAAIGAQSAYAGWQYYGWFQDYRTSKTKVSDVRKWFLDNYKGAADKTCASKYGTGVRAELMKSWAGAANRDSFSYIADWSCYK